MEACIAGREFINLCWLQCSIRHAQVFIYLFRHAPASTYKKLFATALPAQGRTSPTLPFYVPVHNRDTLPNYSVAPLYSY